MNDRTVPSPAHDSIPPEFDVPHFLFDLAASMARSLTPTPDACCVRCGAVLTDEARCGVCGRHTEDASADPDYQGRWRVALATPGGF